MPRRSLNGWQMSIVAIIACLLWSTAFAAVKIGLAYMPPLTFAGLRFMLSGLLLVPLFYYQRPWQGLDGRDGVIILRIAAYQTFLLYALFYWGIDLVPASVAAMVIGSAPLVTAIFAHFRMDNDHLSQPKFISLGLGVVGVVVIGLSREPWVSLQGMLEFLGVLILLLSTLAGAAGNIAVAQDGQRFNPIFLNGLQLFLGGSLLLGLGIVLEGAPQLLGHPTTYYGALLWLAFLSATAFSLWFFLLQQPSMRVSALNIWKFIIPVFGVLFSWYLLPDESPTLVAILGMSCIGLAIVLFFYYSREVVSQDKLVK